MTDHSSSGYTAEQVAEIVELVIQKLDQRSKAAALMNLDNCTSQQPQPGTKISLSVIEAAELVGVSKPSIRKRDDAGWEARYYDERGKRHSVYGKAQTEVRKKLVEALTQNSAEADDAADDLTLGQWLAIWQRDFLGNVKHGTAVQLRDDNPGAHSPCVGRNSFDWAENAANSTAIQP